MDRILTRKDHEGNVVVFLPDTLNKDGKLLCWYGNASKAPEEVSIDYYHQTEAVEDEKEVTRMKRQYEKALSHGGPVLLMQRFPRGLMQKIMQELQVEKQQEEQAPVGNTVTAPMLDQERAYYATLKAVRAGRVWKLVDERGETQEILPSEAAALSALESRLSASLH
jgi:hypothetical protein